MKLTSFIVPVMYNDTQCNCNYLCNLMDSSPAFIPWRNTRKFHGFSLFYNRHNLLINFQNATYWNVSPKCLSLGEKFAFFQRTPGRKYSKTFKFDGWSFILQLMQANALPPTHNFRVHLLWTGVYSMWTNSTFRRHIQNPRIFFLFLFFKFLYVFVCVCVCLTW